MSFITWSQLITWSQNLQQAKPQPGHPWICTVQKGQDKYYVVLSENEYQKQSQQNTFWNTKVQKISLKEIIDTSQLFIESDTDDASLFAAIYLNNTFETDYNVDSLLQRIKQQAQKYIQKHNAPSQIHEVLQNMCRHSREKHEQIKAQGIWNQIKYYIWLWFFDQSSRLVNPNVTPCPELGVLENGYLKEALGLIKSRLLLNIESFEEEMKIPLSDPKKLTTLKDVKDWYAKCSPDRMPEAQVTPHAEKNRKRIISLYQIWKDLAMKHDNLTVSNPASTNSTPLQIQ